MAVSQPEIWKDVIGYEGLYQVSSLGRVKRLPRLVPCKGNALRLHRGGIVGGYKSPLTGYLQVRLCRDGKARTQSIHVLVCEAFHGSKPSPEHEVAHNDGSRDNNDPNNLRWATKSENALDRLSHGTQQLGETVHTSKLTADDVREIRARHAGNYGDGVRLAREFGISGTQISHIVKSQHWKHLLEEEAA